MSGTIELRPENSGDFAAIREMVRIAFQTSEHAEGDEHDFVDRQRASGGYIPELALIAESGGEIVGHIMLVRLAPVSGNITASLLLLAELAVALPHRSARLGSRLIAEASERAIRLGFDAQVLVGDPAFYARFGFEPAAHFGLRTVNDIEAKYVLARTLRPGALAGQSGTLALPQ